MTTPSRGASGEADRDETGSRDKGTRQHRQRECPVRECRGLFFAISSREPRGHDINGGHRIVDEQTERDNQRAE
jgi:hypothetical protein